VGKGNNNKALFSPWPGIMTIEMLRAFKTHPKAFGFQNVWASVVKCKCKK